MSYKGVTGQPHLSRQAASGGFTAQARRQGRGFLLHHPTCSAPEDSSKHGGAVKGNPCQGQGAPPRSPDSIKWLRRSFPLAPPVSRSLAMTLWGSTGLCLDPWNSAACTGCSSGGQLQSPGAEKRATARLQPDGAAAVRLVATAPDWLQLVSSTTVHNCCN